MTQVQFIVERDCFLRYRVYIDPVVQSVSSSLNTEVFFPRSKVSLAVSSPYRAVDQECMELHLNFSTSSNGLIFY
jgi:hypothetical protein